MLQSFPQAIVTIGGQVMGAPFFSRLRSIECTDAEGIKNDTVSLVLEDGWEIGMAAIPQTGDPIEVSLGYGAPVLIGRYTVDSVGIDCLPYAMKVGGKSADIREKMKQSKARHWDKKPLSAIVEEIAGEHGLGAKVSDKIASVTHEWLGQVDVSDIHFLEMLAKRHNALFTVKNGTMIFAERGSGETASGGAIPGFSITPAMIIQGTCRVTFDDRSSFKEVEGVWHDRKEAKRKAEKKPSDETAEAVYTIGEVFQSQDEAERAAESKAGELKRASKRACVTILGNPGVTAGQEVTFAGVRPGVDGIPFIASTVRHHLSKGRGFLTSIDMELKA
ncbi:phage late control D [Stappia sp. 22II-S9-Z10]|nr:phage late control D [Stappia sp. 22II-S9-Z10]